MPANRLLLMSHPDDEIIFGWPFWDKATHVLFCSNDRHNPDRRHQRRVDAYQEVARSMGVVAMSLGTDSEFYRLPTRYCDYTLSDFISEIACMIELVDPAIIFTHNAIGEYGNLDHQLVHRIALQTRIPIITTDIFVESNWCPYTHFDPCGDRLVTVSLNKLRYNEYKSIYERHSAWTWGEEPVTRATLYKI